MRRLPLASLVVLAVCAVAGVAAAEGAAAAPAPQPAAAPAPAAAAPAAHTLTATSLRLPGGPPVGMDYLAFDPSTGRMWIPAGNTARVDVLDTATGKLEEISGLPTEKRGERTAGPSGAAVGEGVVFIGNRAGAQVCAFDAKSLAKRGCVTLASTPDGLQYVSVTKELWVTTPRDRSITVLDAKDPAALKVSGKISFEGEPEGYAADQGRGLLFTSLEDKNETLALDARTRKVTAQWKSGCSEKGPRGLGYDPVRQQLFLGCAEAQVRVFDVSAGKAGALLAAHPAGGMVDNLDYLPSRHLLFVASSQLGTLEVSEVSAAGVPAKVGSAATGKGGRSVFVDANGTGYVPDSAGGALWVVKAPAK
jgi:outer membrane protein assembly factor BamB